MRGTETDDYKKLDRVTKNIKLTIILPLILSIKNPGNTKWYDDAAFAVHKETMIHTGGFMNMGTGGAYSQYRKQKMNTKSSTGAKLVGLDYVLTQVIWNRYFLKEQGYKIHNNIIYQDN